MGFLEGVFEIWGRDGGVVREVRVGGICVGGGGLSGGDGVCATSDGMASANFIRNPDSQNDDVVSYRKENVRISLNDVAD